ncbi:competence/damage-inducible protein A [Acutalibacter intestini]|uniref:competence/damage-inducible protein A n=1 Tax=Acutalibacter intestini TaxID=3093659 RepID=UPI002AC9AEC7|nr:competence/damage-inducible protein A [Acutalibacter sp. M00204]
MNAEIISVGTELLLGAVVNTDAAIVARALSTLGIDLMHTSVVGDNPQRLKEAVEGAIARSDLLIMTGGLGPTTDDLTKETTAAAAGKKLALHEESLRRIENYFNEKHVSENQAKQAWLPEGCTVLQNDNGTAPGCAFQAENGCAIIMLPGPPSELAPMLHNYAVPYLKQRQEYTIVSHNVHIYGRGEAPVAQMMDDLMNGENPTLAPYANEGECYLRVTAKAHTTKEADRLCQPLIDEIKKRLGNFVYSVDVDSLEELVVGLLAQQGKTLATAESCTGGLLAKRITDISGSSAVFHMGCVTYANEVKEQLLGVPHEILEEHGAVSQETARAMAEGIVQASGSSLGVGITGIAGPEGGTPEKPVGLVYIALSDGKNTWVAKRRPLGRTKERAWHRHCAASQALDMVRRYLQGLPVVEL